MAKAMVYINTRQAGILEKTSDGKFHFSYLDDYFDDPSLPPVSLTLPKNLQHYVSGDLFAFFMDSWLKGLIKISKCRLLRIDENDDFTRLLKTAGEDTIGAVTVKQIIS